MNLRKVLFTVLLFASFILIGCEKDREEKLLVPYKDTAAVFLNAVANGDGERVCDMLVPVVFEENYETLDECKKDNGKFKELDGDVTYKIVKEERLLGEDYEEWIGNFTDYYGIGKKNISEVIKFEAEFYIDNKKSTIVYFDVVNYNNGWFIVK